MLRNRLLKLGCVVLLGGAGLALGRSPVRADHDLDSYTDEQLEADLLAELDDIEVGDGGQFEPDGEYALGELRGAIINALQDGGDDESESDIDFADLVDEMSEAGTTVGAVVDEALAEADEMALQDGLRSRILVEGGLGGESRRYRFHLAGFSTRPQSLNQRGFTATSVAIKQTVVVTIAMVRRTPRRS
jgi:hypothetical protein